jgi:hypothetical protein
MFRLFHFYLPTSPPLPSSTLTFCVVFDLIRMLNRKVSSWRQSKRRSSGVGYTSISRTPSQTTGIRKHWHTFGLGARSILCICADSHTDADSDTTTRANAPCAHAEGTLLVASNGARPGKANKSKETELAWLEKTLRTLRVHPDSGVARWRQRPKICSRADRRGDDDDLHHHMARLHLMTPTKTVASEERIHTAPPSTSRDDDDTDALMDAEEEEQAGPSQAAEKKLPSSLQGGKGRPENEKEESDEGWEALKRRVLCAEEHGRSPLDISRGNDAELALRELRAQLRRGWAEEMIRIGTLAREPEESTHSTKKQRRNAGRWICENGDLLRCTVTVSGFSRV